MGFIYIRRKSTTNCDPLTLETVQNCKMLNVETFIPLCVFLLHNCSVVHIYILLDTREKIFTKNYFGRQLNG